MMPGMGHGRPTLQCAELEDEICARVAEGESLRAICRSEGMPDRRTLQRWMEKDTRFAAKCAKAHLLQADALQEGMADIEGQTLAGKIDPKAASVVLSSQRWRAEKLFPEKYGNKTALELTGADGGPVVLTDTDRASRIAVILACAAARQAEADVSDIL